MSVALYFPQDEFDRTDRNFDLSADFLELASYFSVDGMSFTMDLINAAEIGADEDYADVEEEIVDREEIVSGTVTRLDARAKALGTSYPFRLDENGDVLTFSCPNPTHGQAAYLICLLLSHLKSLSPVLDNSIVYPNEADIRNLRQVFQYFATAALAAEIRGQAWSFGFPRPDHTGFLEKLSQIWQTLRDGIVNPDPSAPDSPKDDQIDIFAWRGHLDGLPGFLLAGAQVATGANWKDKSIKSHLMSAFPGRWFGRQPVSQMVCYHIIPFARPDAKFRDDVLTLGNILHRLRVPFRVEEAVGLADEGVAIEAFDLLPQAVEWLKTYWRRSLEAA